jgi:hypothetical protein
MRKILPIEAAALGRQNAFRFQNYIYIGHEINDCVHAASAENELQPTVDLKPDASIYQDTVIRT